MHFCNSWQNCCTKRWSFREKFANTSIVTFNNNFVTLELKIIVLTIFCIKCNFPMKMESKLPMCYEQIRRKGNQIDYSILCPLEYIKENNSNTKCKRNKMQKKMTEILEERRQRDARNIRRRIPTRWKEIFFHWTIT